MPVFIDSPLGNQITRLYQDMDECWDREAKALKSAGDHPIRFNHLYAVEKFQDHQRMLHLTGPAVFIAGSGMCTGGRIIKHLKHGLSDPKNDLFFVGYQAKDTPDRAIMEGCTPAKAAIHHLSGYSAHAHIDHTGRVPDLINELNRINPGVPVFIDSPLGIRIIRIIRDEICWGRT